MKKLLVLVLAMIMVLTITACASDKNDTAKDEKETTEEISEETTEETTEETNVDSTAGSDQTEASETEITVDPIGEGAISPDEFSSIVTSLGYVVDPSWNADVDSVAGTVVATDSSFSVMAAYFICNSPEDANSTLTSTITEAEASFSESAVIEQNNDGTKSVYKVTDTESGLYLYVSVIGNTGVILYSSDAESIEPLVTAIGY